MVDVEFKIISIGEIKEAQMVRILIRWDRCIIRISAIITTITVNLREF